MQTLTNILNQTLPFIVSDVVSPFVTAFFTVIGGSVPIAILIYIFSLKEKKGLLIHANEIEKSLPLQEKILEKMSELLESTISRETINENIDTFKQLVESHNMVEENKKFVKYAKDYNFMSAVGHFLRTSNYIPKGISEHKEISKNLPHSLSKDI